MERRKFLQNSSLVALPVLLPKQLWSKSLLQGMHWEPEVREWLLLGKVTYSPLPHEMEQVKKRGFSLYIKEQLNAPVKEDSSVQKKIDELKLDIKYNYRGKNTDEMRPVSFLDKDPLYCRKAFEKIRDKGWLEWIRPAMEVSAANWIRAVYSPWQLREMMVNFWHNHFNVTVNADMPMGSYMPAYDRDVMRKHVFGNFREMLEAVAKSPAMLTYLNNKTSQASPANENYARELFELHTLGQEHYFNDLYDKWRDVPGALEGKPVGYIDEDVYEAARAFTGWTIADGTTLWRADAQEQLPNTGDFFYFEGWHDNYQKRILGHEIKSNMPALYDGKKVLDLLAAHPGTAKHICKKFLRRFMGDEYPPSLLKKAQDTWMANTTSPEQIKITLQTIFESDEFLTNNCTKVKNPFEYIVSVARATEATFTPNTTLHWVAMEMGYKPFMWPSPTGHPDTDNSWMGPGAISSRWKAAETIMKWKEFGAFTFNLWQKTPKGLSYEQITDFWSKKITGAILPAATRKTIIETFAQGNKPSAIPAIPVATIDEQLKTMVQFLISTPEFQVK